MTRSQRTGSRYGKLGGVTVALLLLGILLGYVVLEATNVLCPTKTLTVVETEVTPVVATSEPLSVVHLEPQSNAVPSVLDVVQFPERVATYPEAWSPEYRLPEALVLVAAEDGELDGRATLSGKYLADATPDEVSKLIEGYLIRIEWQIVEMVIEGEQQVVIVTEEIDGTGNGFFVIDAGPDDGSRVMVTLVTR